MTYCSSIPLFFMVRTLSTVDKKLFDFEKPF